MSKLPQAENALVPEKKVVDYLLSLTHRDGRSKALYFNRFGFSAAAWEIFAEALRRHAAEHDVVEIEQTPFGASYAIEGALSAPDGGLHKCALCGLLIQGQRYRALSQRIR